MKILDVKKLAIPDAKLIKFGRFCDHRGYFTESFRKSDLFNNPDLDSLENVEFVQSNESFSKASTVRGLHFQWNPKMGKLVRTLSGHMIDFFLDIRIKSPTFGKISAYDMPTSKENDYGEWIWIPPGFAHGNLFQEDTLIEYFCTGEYNPECEACISLLSKDIDWSLCDIKLKNIFDEIAFSTALITDKDKSGLTVKEWKEDERSRNFLFGK